MVSAAVAVTAFGPGKVILLGEHGAVYGQPALAAPISRGVRVTAVPAEALELDLPDSLSEAQLDALERAFDRAAKLTGYPNVSVSFKSDLPVSMGLGSSGALSVALTRALLEAKSGKRPDAKKVERIAFALEKEFHGTPSGVDHTTSARGTMVLYAKGTVREVHASKPVKVLIALTGGRRPTRVTVGALRERQAKWAARYRKVFGHIGELAREGAKAATKGDLELLGDLMNMNQGFLSGLGLSSERLESMVYKLRSHGALGAKLTGAGGDGGAVIALFREPEQVVKLLREEGIDCFASQLAGPAAL